ncbi:MAG: class 1 isoprenoid biosynthesis enzyme [Olsenella sp.]|nr:class 1 isoprenoid biosynthesis enzyme [Olsenella sp.]
MSYTRHYTETVPYHGTVSYTYPASQSGGSGTVSYSGVVPVNVNIHVDTVLFDHSVAGTSAALGGVAGAVAATEVAQVESIREAGRKIAQTATTGFFNVLKSEFSTKVSEFSNSMKNRAALLAEQGEAIFNVHKQMESDYRAIKARYKKLFNELDSELDHRVKELDAHAFRLSAYAMHNIVERPYTENATKALIQASDTHTVPLKLQCASTKHRASDALDHLGNACRLINDYRSSVNYVMDDLSGSGVTCLPVVYTLQQDFDTRTQRIVVHGEALAENERVKRRVISFVAKRPESEWSKISHEKGSALDNDFHHRVELYRNDKQDSADGPDRQRVSRLMLSMYYQGETETAYAD